MRAANLPVVMSDQQDREATGCSDHPVARTPRLDPLAERGTRFTAGCAHSPIREPVRAAFADRAARIEAFGGLEAVRGGVGASPVPGEAPVFRPGPAAP